MHAIYKDITDRITEAPHWYDSNGVPRYGSFSPEGCPSIYSHHVGLFKIACCYCKAEFYVEMHADIWGKELDRPPFKWHYGDPPGHGCVGDTMNCDDLAVLQFWTRATLGKWERRPDLEGVIDDMFQQSGE